MLGMTEGETMTAQTKGKKGRKFAIRGTALVLEAASAALVADGLEPTKAAAWHRLPKPRGDLSAALKDSKSFAVVDPDSPRPREMLESVIVRGDEALTGHDLVLHELLVTAAYEVMYLTSNGDPSDFIGREIEIPMKQVLTFFGGATRRSHIQRSLAALRSAVVSYGLSGGRRFTDVPLLVGWGEDGAGAGDVIRFMLPSPIWWLLASQPRYARLELAAMASMRTRYGVKLYRRLVWRMSQEEWTEQSSATLIELTTAEAAEWLGYVEAPLHVGHLQTVMKRAVADLGDVRGFSARLLEPRRDHGRGAPLAAFRLSVVLSAPTRHQVPIASATEEELKHIGGVDAPQYRVNGNVWRKAQTLAKRMKISSHAIWIFESWLIALNEALTASRYTDYGYRRFRGAGLLTALRDRPADDVAWDWVLEEFENPDLTCLHENPDLTRAEKAHYASEAHKARYHRYRDHKAGVERKRKTNPITQAIQAAKLAERVAKQRLEKEEEIRLTAELREKEKAGRRERFKTADVAIFEADSLDAYSEYDLNNAVERILENHAWTGTKQIELRLWHRVGGKYVTKYWGYVPASIDDLEEIVAEFRHYVPRFRLTTERRASTGSRRPTFLPSSGVPLNATPATPRAFATAPSIDIGELFESEDDDADYAVYDGDDFDGPDEDRTIEAVDGCPF